MTWKTLNPVVHLLDKFYPKGVRLNKSEMAEIEQCIIRHPELPEKLIIADRLSNAMDGQPLDAETIMIEMTALIVAITVGIHNEQALAQSMLITDLILQRLRDNKLDSVIQTSTSH